MVIEYLARQVKSHGFWLAVVSAAVGRLALTADINVNISWCPFDCSVYLDRAYHLLNGEALGVYDSQTLLKLPGISLWIAFLRFLGIPFILSVNLSYILAGIYALVALHRMKFNSLGLLVAYVVYLLNPVSYSWAFLDVNREPVAVSLLVVIIASMIHILEAVRTRGPAGIHLLVFSLALSFSLLVREEGGLLYSLWPLLLLAGVYQLRRGGGWRTRYGKSVLAMLVMVPLLVVLAGNVATRLWIKEHYGAAIINDFNSGEFPGLLAALRSVKSDTRTRQVAITQDAAKRIGTAVPSLALLVARLRSPPPGEHEWDYGHFAFWVKEAAYLAGLTPDLVSAQNYFRRARLDIEQACVDGRLQCQPDGSGVLPQFRLSWIPILVTETVRSVALMLGEVREQPRGPAPPISPAALPREDVIRMGNRYAVTTFALFDSLDQWTKGVPPVQKGEVQRWDSYEEVLQNLLYWLRYPWVAEHAGLGIPPHLTPEITDAVRKAVAPLQWPHNTSLAALSKAQVESLKKSGLIDVDSFAAWQKFPADLYVTLIFLLKHPESALRLKEGGPAAGGYRFGAIYHYIVWGRAEGRIWSPLEPRLWQGPPADLAVKPYVSPLSGWRGHIPKMALLNWLLLALGAAALIVQVVRRRKQPLSSFHLVVFIVLLFCSLEVVALAYVNVTVEVPARLYYSGYVALVLLASLLTFEGAKDLVKKIASMQSVK